MIRTSSGFVCGVDEAGRGPLAGPVIAAAVILNPNNYPIGLNDSKKLSQKKREYLLNDLQESAISIGIGIAEPEEIDRFNILHASLRAMARAVDALNVPIDMALIDGNKIPTLSMPAQAVIKGDSLSVSIAAASIVAKVTRDQVMQAVDLRFPQYGFAGHKGYPTQAHREAVARYGPCPVHRRSFQPIKAFYETQEY